MANPPFLVPAYLKAQEELFRAATQQLQAHSNPQSLTKTAEWLPDNFYLIQQACRQIREDMPAKFYRQLPKYDAGPLHGYPRIYGFAQKLIVLRQARLNLAHMTRFVQFYPSLAQLTTGELWALAVMLLLGLIDFLAQATPGPATAMRIGSHPSRTIQLLIRQAKRSICAPK